MPTPPPGFSPDPANPGWWLKGGADPEQDDSWWQAVPEGWVLDPNDPNWYFNPAGDLARSENWWHDGRVQDPTPVYEAPWYLPAFAAFDQMMLYHSPYDFGGDRTRGYSPVPQPPAKGWDCVGAVMNALDNCSPPLGDFLSGINQGYINAEKARQLCPKISESEVKPGDLIFFHSTYSTPGASHIGLVKDPAKSLMYDDNGSRPNGVGPGVTDYSSPYWKAHFLSYGRVPR